MGKKEAKKVFTIILIAFVVVLVVAGIVCVNIVSHSGQEQQLISNESFMSQIRDVSNSKPLTDDQFMSGLDRLFPVDTTEQSEYISKMRTISHELDEMGVRYNIERINYFGTCACLLKLSDSIEIANLQNALNNAGFSRVYIHINSTESGAILQEYLYDGVELTETYNSSEPIGDEITNEEVSQIFSDICSEYGISGSTLTFTGEVLQIQFNNISFTNVLDIFDFLYRWCRQSELETTIRLFDGDRMLANAFVDLDDLRFESYYPASDLTATYRIKYYQINDYLKDELREASNSFLIE